MTPHADTLLPSALLIIGFVLLVILVVPPLRRMVWLLIKIFLGLGLVWLLGWAAILLLAYLGART